MMKFIALLAFVGLALHALFVKTVSLGTANLRMALALVFIGALLMALRQEFDEFLR